jgi:hypothetical protein
MGVGPAREEEERGGRKEAEEKKRRLSTLSVLSVEPGGGLLGGKKLGDANAGRDTARGCCL